MNKKSDSKITKNKGGRPTKYNDRYYKMLIDHFSCPKSEKYIKSERIIVKKNGTKETFYEYGYRCTDLPTFAQFARKIEVNQETVSEWAKSENKQKYPGFSVAYNMAKELQKEFLIDNALKGFYPPASFIFIAKNITNMRDKQEIDHTTKEKQIVGFNYYVPIQTNGKITYKKSDHPPNGA